MKTAVEMLLVCFMCVLSITDYSCPYTGLNRPLGFQEAEAPRFVDNRHVKVARLSFVLTGRLYFTRYPWYSFLLDAESTPQGHSAAGRIQSVTPSGNEPATFRLVEQ
jgi:hypothetical protein